MSAVQDFMETYGFAMEYALTAVLLIGRLERRGRAVPRFALALALLAGCSAFWKPMPQHVLAQTCRTLSFWTVIAAGIWLCCRVPLVWAAFYATAGGTIQHIAFRGAKLLQQGVFMLTGNAPLAWGWLYAPFFLLICMPAALWARRRLWNQGSRPLPGTTVLMLLVGMQIMLNLFVNLFNVYGSQAGPDVFTIYSVFDLITSLFLLMLICEVVDKNNAEYENAVLQQMMERQRQQLEMSRDTVELINIKCHDIKKQLSSLGGSVPQQELDELKRAMEIYDTKVDTGCEALDVLLAERMLLCRSRHIQLDYMVDGRRLNFLHSGEVYSLFGNALDNAIEAVSALPDEEKRYISLQVLPGCGGLSIRVENYTDHPVEADPAGGLPRTTKADCREHGFGMKSMQRMAEKYGGSLSYQLHNGLFTLTVLFPGDVQTAARTSATTV